MDKYNKLTLFDDRVSGDMSRFVELGTSLYPQFDRLFSICKNNTYQSEVDNIEYSKDTNGVAFKFHLKNKKPSLKNIQLPKGTRIQITGSMVTLNIGIKEE